MVREKTPSLKKPKATADSPSLTSDVNIALLKAKQSESWMVGVWRVENNQVILDRTVLNFPIAEMDLAVSLLIDNLKKLKAEGDRPKE
jgi:hypothetical protein